MLPHKEKLEEIRLSMTTFQYNVGQVEANELFKPFPKTIYKNATICMENIVSCSKYIEEMRDLNSPEIMRAEQSLNQYAQAFKIYINRLILADRKTKKESNLNQNEKEIESVFDDLLAEQNYVEIMKIINVNQKIEDIFEQERQENLQHIVDGLDGKKEDDPIPVQEPNINYDVRLGDVRLDDVEQDNANLGQEHLESFKMLWSGLVDFKLFKSGGLNRNGFLDYLKIIPDFFHDVISGLGLLTRGIVRTLFYVVRHPSALIGKGWLWGETSDDHDSKLNGLQYFFKEVGIGFDNFISRPFETAKSLLDISENNLIARLGKALLVTAKAAWLGGKVLISSMGIRDLSNEENEEWETLKDNISTAFNNAVKAFKERPIRYITELVLWVATIVVTWKFASSGGNPPPPPPGEEFTPFLGTLNQIASVHNRVLGAVPKGFVPPLQSVPLQTFVIEPVGLTTIPSSIPVVSNLPKNKMSNDKKSLGNKNLNQQPFEINPQPKIQERPLLTKKDKMLELLNSYKSNLSICSSENYRSQRNEIIEEIVKLENEVKPSVLFSIQIKVFIQDLQENLEIFNPKTDKEEIEGINKQITLLQNDLFYYEQQLSSYKPRNEEISFIWEKENTSCSLGTNRHNMWSEENKEQEISNSTKQSNSTPMPQYKTYGYNN